MSLLHDFMDAESEEAALRAIADHAEAMAQACIDGYDPESDMQLLANWNLPESYRIPIYERLLTVFDPGHRDTEFDELTDTLEQVLAEQA